jgi:hypothetical protein
MDLRTIRSDVAAMLSTPGVQMSTGRALKDVAIDPKVEHEPHAYDVHCRNE